MAIVSLAGGAHAGKVGVCHKGQSILIDDSALSAHKAHGDQRGRCEDRNYTVVTIFRCGVSPTGGLTVTVVSSSADFPIAVPQVEDADNCADANATFMDYGFNLKNVTSGPVGGDFETESFYERKFLDIHRQ